MLAQDERELLEQLSVFAGGWTLEAAEAVSDSDLVLAWHDWRASSISRWCWPNGTSILELDVCNMASVQPRSAPRWTRAPSILSSTTLDSLRGAVEEIEPDEMLRQFDTNVFGAIRVVRAVTPTMRER